MMKETLNAERVNLPKVRIDKSLNKYDDIVLFPDQVKRAKKMFEQAGGIDKVIEVIRQHQLK